MKFTSKEQLLRDIEGEHDRFLAILASVPHARRRDAGVWGDDWTVLDLVAHLAEWHGLFLRWYLEGRAGRTPALPAPGFKWNQLPELNLAIWRKHRGRSSASIMRGFERSYREIRDTVVDLTPGDLLKPGRFAWTGKYPLTTYLAPNTSSHYRFATRILRRWTRRRAADPGSANGSDLKTTSGRRPAGGGARRRS